MTREEAIKRLKETRSTIQPFGYVDEALDVAIKELEHEPILDKIRAEINDVAFDWQEIDGEHENFKVVNLNDVINIIDKHKPCQREKELELEAFRKFAEWVARELFDDDWPHNMDAFVEVACRKLSKLGLVKDLGEIWGLADCFYTQKSEEDKSMIITKYPELVEAQLKIIDEKIEAIYREYENVKLKPDEAMRLKRNLAERIKPFVDEKVRLISNSCPIYEVRRKRNERKS